MSDRQLRVLRPTAPSLAATTVIAATVAFTAAFLLSRYRLLPDLLPVRFNRFNGPIGWQWKTLPRVLMPVFVQVTLALVSGVISMLVLSRSHGSDDREADDVRAARTAAEALLLFASIWVVFQAYGAVALVRMWETGVGGLGAAYNWLMIAGVLLSVVVGRRAHVRLGRPGPREFVAEHWRLGQLYTNAADPALFVPTRDGSRWTLNFGRPVAAALIAVVLTLGMVGPIVILKLLLR